VLICHLLKMSSVGTSYLRSSGAGESIVEESAATDAEAETVELDAEGKQVGPGKQRWTPQEALEKMQSMKKGGRAKWWQHLQPVLVKVQGEHKCFLKCTAGEGRCGKLMRISNPAATASDHLTVRGCKGIAMLEAQQSLIAKRSASVSSEPGSSSKQMRMDSHIVSHSALLEARRRLSLFFIKSNVAFKLVEQEDLVAAFACLGMSSKAMPSRKVRTVS